MSGEVGIILCGLSVSQLVRLGSSQSALGSMCIGGELSGFSATCLGDTVSVFLAGRIGSALSALGGVSLDSAFSVAVFLSSFLRKLKNGERSTVLVSL